MCDRLLVDDDVVLVTVLAGRRNLEVKPCTVTLASKTCKTINPKLFMLDKSDLGAKRLVDEVG